MACIPAPLIAHIAGAHPGGAAAAAGRFGDHYAELRAALKKKGQLIGSNDLLIAAHARSSGAVVVTNNVRDFSRVKGLEAENWTV